MARLFTQSMRDQNGLLLDAAEVVGSSFPTWKCQIDPNASCTITTNNSTITFVLNDDGESLIAKWTHKSLWDPEGSVLSDDTLWGRTDIVGWVSMIKTDMINAGIKRLVRLFQGPNIFPEGDKTAVKAFVESSQVFSDFMMQPDQVVDYLFKALAPVYRPLWQVKGTDWYMPLEGVQVGAMVARIDGNRTKWRIKIPFLASVIDFRGHFDIPPGDYQKRFGLIPDRIVGPKTLDALRADMPDILLRKLIESVIVGHLSAKVPVMTLPPDWVHARNQATDGWTT